MGLIIPIERIRKVKEEKKTKDYISRDAAIDAVFGAMADGRAVFPALNNLPAADVRRVVFCRDCKNNYNTCFNHGINEPMCDFTDRKLREDDFCSRGVKREES